MCANLSAVFADICDRASESRLEAVCRATLLLLLQFTLVGVFLCVQAHVLHVSNTLAQISIIISS